MKRGKRYLEVKSKIDPDKEYTVEEAIDIIKSSKSAKFDETVDVVIRLGIDTRKSDQQVRGAVVMPKGLGKQVRVLAFTKGESEALAKEAGAEFVGAEDMAEKVSGGWYDFDAVVATPNVMSIVGKLGKALGPRGLMPNPKTGTVTNDIASAIKEIKAGKSEYRADKAGIVHAPVGKVSFAKEDLKENAKVFISEILRVKPAGAKGTYVKKIVMSSVMGPGIRISRSDVVL